MSMRLSRLSLRWRLSWLLAMTAVLAVTAFGFFAYRAARSSAIEATHARLRSAVTQISTISELGAVTQLDLLRAAASDPAVIEALRNPQRPVSAEVRVLLQRLQGSAVRAVVAELLGSDGKALYATPSELTSPGAQPAFELTADGTIGPLMQHEGALYLLSGIAIEDAGVRLGRIRVTRRLATGTANRRIATNLLGEDAVLLVGNRDGVLWSDSAMVQYPGGENSPTVYERNGTRWLSASVPVRGTPWLYAVDLPERVALAPARDLILPFGIAGSVIALSGILLGLRASRRITNPLAELTAAAEAMARGERQVSLVATERHDEIGRLARAFGTMATSVHAVQDRLESEVGERTGELSEAVERLRQLDRELRQSERFAMLGRLSGAVGHELRNPLGVMSTVVLLLDGLPDASPKLKDYARLLREQIRLSERIISDLLDRARSGAPVRSTVDVTRLLDDVLAHAAVPASIRIERRYAVPLAPVVLDRDHVRQIVWNLVTNAVHAMQPTGGTLTVVVSVAGGHLRIEVRDTGPGIAAADVDRIFEPMYTTKAQGVGLGLSISREVARANGGDLYVAGIGRGGACFVLDLPVMVAVDVEAPMERSVDRREPPQPTVP